MSIWMSVCPDFVGHLWVPEPSMGGCLVTVAGILKLSQPGLTCSSFLPDDSNSWVSPESQSKISQVSNSAPETRRLSLTMQPQPLASVTLFYLILHTVPFPKRLMVMYPYSHTEESVGSSVSEMKTWRLKDVVIGPRSFICSLYIWKSLETRNH